jgi:hypothetical protein
MVARAGVSATEASVLFRPRACSSTGCRPAYTPSADYESRGASSGVGLYGMLGSEYTLVEKTNVLRDLADTFAVMYPQLYGVDFRRDVPSLEVSVYLLDGAAELEGGVTSRSSGSTGSSRRSSSAARTRTQLTRSPSSRPTRFRSCSSTPSSRRPTEPDTRRGPIDPGGGRVDQRQRGC